MIYNTSRYIALNCEITLLDVNLHLIFHLYFTSSVSYLRPRKLNLYLNFVRVVVAELAKDMSENRIILKNIVHNIRKMS